MFAKQSMINRLSNPINRNRSAAKISKVMSSSFNPTCVTYSCLFVYTYRHIKRVPAKSRWINSGSNTPVGGGVPVRRGVAGHDGKHVGEDRSLLLN